MIGERLNKVRKSKGFTAQQMADVAGINLHSYRHYESNRRQPSYDILVKIVDKLDISLDYLLCRDDFITSREVSADED